MAIDTYENQSAVLVFVVSAMAINQGTRPKHARMPRELGGKENPSINPEMAQRPKRSQKDLRF
jgi:hypothetical protein